MVLSRKFAVCPVCFNGGHDADPLIAPAIQKSRHQGPNRIAADARPSSAAPSSRPQSTPAGHQRQNAAPATFPEPAPSQHLASGYAVAPPRADLAPATNKRPKNKKAQQHPQTGDALEGSATSQQLQEQQAPQKRRHAGRGVAALTPTTQQQQQSGTPAAPAKKSLRTGSKRRYDPAKAFMNAGLPPGLWVLPLEAKVDAAPAPPPVAPEDPQELLKVLQSMPAPRRRLVIFKAGGYIYADMENLIDQAGLSHVCRLTNLIRKAGCVLAKNKWDNGRHVNLTEHQAAARKARVPFLLLERLDAVDLVALLRPLLVKKGIVVERGGQG